MPHFRTYKLPKPKQQSLRDRFFAKVQKTDICWNWTAYRNRAGYGQFAMGHGTVAPAHRVSLFLETGQWPDKAVDHLCRNTGCVNPKHLEIVGYRINSLRSDKAKITQNLAKTHCPQGHPYKGFNLQVRPNGHRHCRVCDNKRAGDSVWWDVTTGSTDGYTPPFRKRRSAVNAAPRQ